MRSASEWSCLHGCIGAARDGAVKAGHRPRTAIAIAVSGLGEKVFISDASLADAIDAWMKLGSRLLGGADVWILMVANNLDSFRELLVNQIRGADGVATTSTRLVDASHRG